MEDSVGALGSIAAKLSPGTVGANDGGGGRAEGRGGMAGGVARGDKLLPLADVASVLLFVVAVAAGTRALRDPIIAGAVVGEAASVPIESRVRTHAHKHSHLNTKPFTQP